MSYDKVTQAKLNQTLLIGTKQTVKAIHHNQIAKVFVAADADTHITAKVVEAAENRQVPLEIVDSMKQLGRACGIDVGAATVAILKD